MDMVLDDIIGRDTASIAFRVALRQEMLGLEDTDMAEQLGMTLQVYRRLRKGLRPFDTDCINDLSRILDCSHNYLMDIPDGLGNGAVEYLIILYWQALPEPKNIPWVREGFLETLRKTVVGHVLEGKRYKDRATRLRNDAEEENES